MDLYQELKMIQQLKVLPTFILQVATSSVVSRILGLFQLYPSYPGVARFFMYTVIS